MSLIGSVFSSGLINGLNYSYSAVNKILPNIFQNTKSSNYSTFQEGDFNTYDSLKTKTIKKVEFFNNYTGKFEVVNGDDLIKLSKIGLNGDKLEKIISVYSKWNNINLNMYSFTDFIYFLIEKAERNYINDNSVEIFQYKFWELVESLDDENIYKFAEENQCLFRDEHNESALILESFSETDKAFDRKGIENLSTVSMISKVYNVCSRTFSSVNQFCEIIKDHTKKSLTKLLLIKAHGNINGLYIHSELTKKETKLGFGSSPIDDCFKYLKDKATIIVDACESGYGGPFFPNFANFLGNNVPFGTNIISSDLEQIKTYININNHHSNYVIYSTNTIGKIFTKSTGYFFRKNYDDEKLCPIDKISYLDFCTKFPVFKFEENINGEIEIWFHSNYFKVNFKFSSDNPIEFIDNLGLNNKDFEQISLSPILRIKDQFGKLRLYFRSIYENTIYKLPKEFEPYFMVREFNIDNFLMFIKENKHLITNVVKEERLYFQSTYDDILYMLPYDISNLILDNLN